VIEDAFGMETLLMGIVAPLIVGWPIGDEIEDKTATYLWARPIARWTVLIGKLAALAPIVFAVFMLGWLAVAAVTGVAPSGQQIGALALGAFAASCAAAGLALLLPKHPLILSLIVLAVIDQTLGAMPASIRTVTISQNTRVLGGISDGDPTSAAITLLVITALWLYLGLWRIKKTQL
jgi:ABC-type transport system involved in multi-copper enzyme maturation permease subunit